MKSFMWPLLAALVSSANLPHDGSSSNQDVGAQTGFSDLPAQFIHSVALESENPGVIGVNKATRDIYQGNAQLSGELAHKTDREKQYLISVFRRRRKFIKHKSRLVIRATNHYNTYHPLFLPVSTISATESYLLQLPSPNLVRLMVSLMSMFYYSVYKTFRRYSASISVVVYILDFSNFAIFMSIRLSCESCNRRGCLSINQMSVGITSFFVLASFAALSASSFYSIPECAFTLISIECLLGVVSFRSSPQLLLKAAYLVLTPSQSIAFSSPSFERVSQAFYTSIYAIAMSFFRKFASSVRSRSVIKESAVLFPVLNPLLCPLRMSWLSKVFVSLAVKIAEYSFLKDSSSVIGLIFDRLPLWSFTFGSSIIVPSWSPLGRAARLSVTESRLIFAMVLESCPWGVV
ncbi:hypothetical protein MIR68_007207 [Amoeboaphelidium protococcarum]|nr:hypothetical protein MIR68_007207 [Amoeboaphelidium protococcarum]